MVLTMLWWGRTDSNHRSESQQIYSLPPLATRELPLIWSFMSESNQQPADYKSAALPLSQWSLFGGNNRDRTCDPLLVRQMLSQLSYASISISIKLNFKWWGRTDSNHRSESQQIYSLPPLATRELPHLELHVGVEPTTCWLQVSCSAIEPMKHIQFNFI